MNFDYYNHKYGDNTNNKAFKFRTKNWAEVNDDAYGTYSF